ncbi:MAG TPA: 50S ribosomal protein L10 [Candidatus Eisenbacteria bacterium]|uniref:Large ribosomal subunit protein uL10 n=1 Tax=Eiseniibacteriota bacterium TaxID=2212470 RepID=A0A7V2AUZ4_UNCEI|nr:50S ribosomal protein L10 [Candidatus Eisenbacteria bacterium]
MIQPGKIKTVEELEDIIRGAKSVILNDFTGLNVSDISELRRLCRENGVTYRVVKNTLAKKGFRDLGLEEVEELLAGPTAIAVSLEDEALPAQILKKFSNDYELPRFKGGYVAGRLLEAQEVERLALLPGRDVLLGQVVGTFQAPMRGLLNCLVASLRDLVTVLKAVSEKKGAA